jgi:hypothetical protein
MEKGDFFGEMSVLEGLPRTYSAEAIEECELIEINSMTFDRMIRANIEIAVRMLRKLSIRLRDAEKLIETLEHNQPPVSTAREDMAAPAAAAIARALAGAPPAPASSTEEAPKARPAPPLAIPSAAPLGAKAIGEAGAPRAKGASRALGPRLVSEDGESVFTLSGEESLIGRYDPVTETQPAVDLTPIDIKRSVSRRHARITTSNGGYFVTEEIGALNGTFVNGAPTGVGRPVPLNDGDCVTLGTVRLFFRL